MGLLEYIREIYKIDLIESFKIINYNLDRQTNDEIWFINKIHNLKIRICWDMGNIAFIIYDNENNLLDGPCYPVRDNIFYFSVIEECIKFLLERKGIQLKENKKETVITKVEPIKFEKGTYQDFINMINNINENIKKQTEILNKLLEEVKLIIKK